MALDKTTASGVLKEFYLPTVHDQLVNKNEYLAQLEKNDQDVEGTEAVLSLHVGRNQGIGARKERLRGGGDTLLPASAHQHA